MAKYKYCITKERKIESAMASALNHINAQGWEVISHSVHIDDVGFTVVTFVVKEKE